MSKLLPCPPFLSHLDLKAKVKAKDLLKLTQAINCVTAIFTWLIPVQLEIILLTLVALFIYPIGHANNTETCWLPLGSAVRAQPRHNADLRIKC